MRIQTKYLGEVELNEKQLISFPSGLPGFAEESRFVLLDLPGGNPVFQILQSTATPDVAFVVTNPYHFSQEYEFELDTNVKENLLIRSKEDVTVFSIVTLNDPFEESTLNLKAPVIINPASKRGKQYILNHEDYSTRALIKQSNSSETKGV